MPGAPHLFWNAKIQSQGEGSSFQPSWPHACLQTSFLPASRLQPRRDWKSKSKGQAARVGSAQGPGRSPCPAGPSVGNLPRAGRDRLRHRSCPALASPIVPAGFLFPGPCSMPSHACCGCGFSREPRGSLRPFPKPPCPAVRGAVRPRLPQPASLAWALLA